MQPPAALISGAGLVGALLAFTLKRMNHSVLVTEKRPPKEDNSGRSINLVITTRGLHALDQVGLKQSALKLSVPVEGRMIHSMDRELSYQPYGRGPHECNYSISRLMLNDLLITEAQEIGASFEFNCELDYLDIPNKKAFYKKGSPKDWNIFFGCDGASSPARNSLTKHLGGKSYTEWSGLGYKELAMPAKKGEYSMEKNALHIWPRGKHMLMALPNQDGSFTMTLYLPLEGDISFEKFQNSKDFNAYFEKYYPDAVSLMPNYEEDFFNNPLGKLGTIHCSPWSTSNMVLVGDAAHAILPFFGQGMNAGFEDVICLNQLMNKYEKWETVFYEYDKTQRPNGKAIAEMAIENFTEMAYETGLPSFLMRKQVESILEKNFPDQYRSRYGMVVYTHIPYALAQEGGRIQENILKELCTDLKNAEAVNLKKAKELIDKHFTPFIQKNNLSNLLQGKPI